MPYVFVALYWKDHVVLLKEYFTHETKFSHNVNSALNMDVTLKQMHRFMSEDLC